MPPTRRLRSRCVSIADLCFWSQYGLVHISAGDLLRAEIEEGTEDGKRAKGYMDKGQLVPNEVVVQLVKNRLAKPDAQKAGWLLDGYPRSAEQAEAIKEAGINPDVFILINVRLLSGGYVYTEMTSMTTMRLLPVMPRLHVWLTTVVEHQPASHNQSSCILLHICNKNFIIMLHHELIMHAVAIQIANETS